MDNSDSAGVPQDQIVGCANLISESKNPKMYTLAETWKLTRLRPGVKETGSFSWSLECEFLSLLEHSPLGVCLDVLERSQNND
jgi:hypothetical protein